MSKRTTPSSARAASGAAAGAGGGGAAGGADLPGPSAKKRVRSITTDGVADAAATDFITFVNNSPSPFHATAEAESRLLAAGFEKISEREAWAGKVKPNGKYYTTRNRSSLVAFCVGGAFKPGSAVTIVAAHTDSPCLKIKPISKKSAHGYLQVGVECYGGGLWHTWFDRDLGVAGRVVIKDEDGTFSTRLVRINRPILRVPTLAIHLNRTVNSDGFKFNQETHLAPVLALEASEALGLTADGEHHHSKLLDLLAKELGVSPAQIDNLDLFLFDTNPSCIGGADMEFIFSARLDNLMMSYTSIEALLHSSDATTLASDPTCRMVALFDNEEVGSSSLMGAGSTLLEHAIRRLNDSAEAFAISLRKSFLVSADMAHAVHPNYPSKHEDAHRPKMNKGVVVKTNGNQRYATSGVTSHVLKQAAALCGAPLQEFVVRQDMGCGSTIGPILSTSLGMRTVDVGIAQLSMHSVREMCGAADVASAVALFRSFYNNFASIDEALSGFD